MTIEKVITLASVSMFAEVPDELLVDVASVLEEVAVSAGEEIVHQGDVGTSTYIIVAGKVRVHDGMKELRLLGEGEVFGELAALDPEPRSASVTALEDTHLFRMEQAALLDLLTQHVEVARGILRVLCQRLRQNNALLRALSPPPQEAAVSPTAPTVPAFAVRGDDGAPKSAPRTESRGVRVARSVTAAARHAASGRWLVAGRRTLAALAGAHQSGPCT